MPLTRLALLTCIHRHFPAALDGVRGFPKWKRVESRRLKTTQGRDLCALWKGSTYPQSSHQKAAESSPGAGTGTQVTRLSEKFIKHKKTLGPLPCCTRRRRAWGTGMRGGACVDTSGFRPLFPSGFFWGGGPGGASARLLPFERVELPQEAKSRFASFAGGAGGGRWGRGVSVAGVFSAPAGEGKGKW